MDVKKILSLLLMCLFSTSAFSATIEDYAALPEMQNVSISPDGTKLTFQQNRDGKRYAVVMDLKNKKLLKAFDLQEFNARDFYFLTDNIVILQVSEVMSMYGGREQEYSGAYAYNIKQDKTRKTLTLGKEIYVNQTGVGEIIGISDDHKYAYMPAYTETTGGGGSSIPYSVMRVNLQKRGARSIFKGNTDTRDYFVNSDGDVLAQVIMYDHRDKFVIKGRVGKKLKTIFEEDTDRPSLWVNGLSPDLKSLYITYTSQETNGDVMALLSLETGEITDTDLVDDGKDVERVFQTTNRVLQGIRYSGLKPSYHFFDEALNLRVQKILEMFPNSAVWIESISDDLSNILVMADGVNFAGDYYLFSKDNDVTALGSQYPNIKESDIHPQATWGFKASDGLRIPVIMTIPKDRIDSMKQLPTVVLPHGGPASYDRLGFDWLSQSLAEQGYLVVQPQFRGSTGFGAKHHNAGFGEWGQKMQSDITETVQKLVGLEHVDPENVCIVGWSYGGYAALAGGAFTPDLYKCVISVNGVADLPSMLSSEKRDHSRNSWVVAYWEDQMAGQAKPKKDYLRSISPSYHAENFKAPVLLVHGDDDTIVRERQSKKMASALKKHDKPYTYVEVKNDGHSLTQHGSRIEMMQHILPFLAEHIGSKQQQ